MTKEQERLDRLAQVAVWYYEERLEQSEIAKRIGRSVSMVSRMLADAHREGLIEIRVRYAIRTNAELERQLVDCFGLQAAHILQRGDTDVTDVLVRRKLGELGARCLQETLHDGDTIGMGWGRTLSEVVNAVSPTSLPNATVIQLMGAMGSKDPMNSGSELGRRLASKLGAKFEFLHSPLQVETADTAKSLMKDHEMKRVLNLARKSDVALVAIGGVDPAQTVSVSAGYMTVRDLNDLKRVHAVGDVIARYIDCDGKEVDHPINHRVVALDLASLKRIPTVIGITMGADRAAAILAAIRGGYVKTLVTDSNTAQEVLRVNAEPRRGS